MLFRSTADPGQWSRVKGVLGQQLRDGVLPINYKEPSTVLFQLLGLLIQTSKDLTASTDALQGSMNATNVPATSMLAMIEQGMKMFSAIQKRLYRSLKDEYQKLYRLNKIHLDPQEYNELVGDENGIGLNDYNSPSIKIIPIADPNLASDAQRMAQSQLLLSLLKQGLNDDAIFKRVLTAAKVPNVEEFLVKAEAQPNPAIVKAQLQHQAAMASTAIKAQHQDLKEKEFAAKLPKTEAEINQIHANVVKLVSSAQNQHKETNIREDEVKLSAIKAKMQSDSQERQTRSNSDIAHKQMALQINRQSHEQMMDYVSGLQKQQPQEVIQDGEAQPASDSELEQPPSYEGDA